MKFTHNKNEYELIILTTAGSRLYGNSRPESDWDYRGVFIAPLESKLGLLGTVDQIEGKDVWKSLTQAGIQLEETDDIVLYELSKFTKLAIDNNPNIMDILCHNTELASSIYVSNKGKELLDNKDLFLSKKAKFTFSGYAISQLKRIQGHNKMIHKYPHTGDVLYSLEVLFKTELIDWDFIVENFGGQVAMKVTGETAQNHSEFNSLDYNAVKNFISVDFPTLNLDEYRIPRLIDYISPRTLKNTHLKLDDIIGEHSIRELLESKASFRSFGRSTIAVYTEGTGIFGKEGNLRVNESEHLGDFVCLATINQDQYKADKDAVNKMWEWKCNRNEARSELEDKFGYDTKHASHLVRLMKGAELLLKTGEYIPELQGEMLDLVNDTKNGKYTYEEILKFSEDLDDSLNELYKTSTLINKAEIKAINKLLINLQLEPSTGILK